MNEEQREIYRWALHLCLSQVYDVHVLTHSCSLLFVTVSSKVVAGGLHFIDAPGGTGKTYLLTCLIAKWRSQGKIVLCVAPSGLAATLMEDGRTVHGRFRVQLSAHK